MNAKKKKKFSSYSLYSLTLMLHLYIEDLQVTLKALFNNVFTLNNLSCMTLHAISVFDNV